MKLTATPSVVIFGANGSIGYATCLHFAEKGWRVLAFSRQAQSSVDAPSNIQWLVWDGEPDDDTLAVLRSNPIDAVVWAQGRNCSDNISDFNSELHWKMYEANVLFILRALSTLLAEGLLAAGARLCIVSSIWQEIARPNKLSYCITKSALRGLVQSVALDLGPKGYLINAVLPGALDTAMTRANLSATQIQSLADMTPIKRLVSLDEVCATAAFLCSPSNTCITGQFVVVDGGFSSAKVL